MIYIQSNNEKTLAHHFDCSCALYGAIETGQEYRLATLGEVNGGMYDTRIKSNLFVGSTEFMQAVFKRVGLMYVRLPRNSNRESTVTTLTHALAIAKSGKKIFVKPVEIKIFTGLVLDGMNYTCLNDVSGTTKVLVYEPFRQQLMSEWRVYVHEHKMVDSRNYAGEFSVSPLYGYVDEVIKSNKQDFPCAYTIDIGIMNYYGQNVVIEYNDMWAIGNYGIPNDLYLRLLKDRYFEIIKQK